MRVTLLVTTHQNSVWLQWGTVWPVLSTGPGPQQLHDKCEPRLSLLALLEPELELGSVVQIIVLGAESQAQLSLVPHVWSSRDSTGCWAGKSGCGVGGSPLVLVSSVSAMPPSPARSPSACAHGYPFPLSGSLALIALAVTMPLGHQPG